MLKYAELFIEHLQKVNPLKVDFKVEVGVDEDGNEAIARIKIPYAGTNITASFFGDKKGSHFSATMAIGMIAPNCVDLVSQEVFALCNELNNKNRWVKFCVRDGNSIPGMNGALICLEEATILAENTAAQDAYSIVSNLIKAHTESVEPFKKILNRNPAETEKADNRPVIKNEKPKEIQESITREEQKKTPSAWLSVLIEGCGIVFLLIGAILDNWFGLVGCVLVCCGLWVMSKLKKKRKEDLMKLKDPLEYLSVHKQQQKKTKLPIVLTWILFAFAMFVLILV